MRKGILYLLIFLVLLVAPTGIRYLNYYDLGGSQRQTPPQYDPGNVPDVPTPASAAFEDDPQSGEGFVLLDEAHGNDFTVDEIGYLDGRLAARGYELLYYTGGDLSLALRTVSAFVVITPQDNFDRDEIQALANFVARGGRLLLVGDPTRFTVDVQEDEFGFTVQIENDDIPLNTLANQFGIIFKGDYLYNTVENEGNFRNIILENSGFAENSLTDGLQQLVFYGSHSLQVGPESEPVITADDNTWSSATDRPGGLVLAATSHQDRVLALGDVHFLTAPYYTVHDNAQFIARVADFLTSSERTFVLSDFPYFLGEAVDLVYTGAPELGPDAFDEIIALQDALRAVDRTLSLAAEPQAGQDAIYLGLYNQSAEIASMLEARDISLVIDPPILTEEEMAAADDETAEETEDEDEEAGTEAVRLVQSGLGNVQMSGTSLVLLDESNGRRSLVVLAASSEGLENTVNRLLDLIPIDADYALADCLLQSGLALCPTGVADEEVEAELLSGGAPEVDKEEAEEGEAEEEEAEEAEEEPADREIPEAASQGTIAIDDSIESETAEDEIHAWTFNEGPATIDIVVESGDDFDAVLELYDPDDEFIDASDSGFTGDSESLTGVEIPDDGDYTIIVYDFFNDGGSYTLSVTLSEEGEEEEEEEEDGEETAGDAVFIFADDDGEALADGFTSADALAALLQDEYEVTVWVASEDGPLEAEALEGQNLIIWDSGDYQDESGFLNEDSSIIFDHLSEGGNLFINGTSPTVLGEVELASLSDLEVTGDDPVLLDGLAEGEIIALDQAYDALVFATADLEDDNIPLFWRGPESEESGSVAGFASMFEENGNEQRTILLFAPFVALPDDVQETFLSNTMTWFGLGNG